MSGHKESFGCNDNSNNNNNNDYDDDNDNINNNNNNKIPAVKKGSKLTKFINTSV